MLLQRSCTNSLLCPSTVNLSAFSLPDMSNWADRCVQTATAGVQAFVRFGSAAFVASNLANFRKRPQKPIELYEYEGGRPCGLLFSAASKAKRAA